jgi:hypothetical protein
VLAIPARSRIDGIHVAIATPARPGDPRASEMRLYAALALAVSSERVAAGS